MSGGIVARPAEMRLTERAADYLAAGPADVVALIGHVCQLPNPPRFVAEHMAAALFAERTEFTRDESGHWRLAAHRAAPRPASVHEREGPNQRVADIVGAVGASPVAAPDPPTHRGRPRRRARLPLIDPLSTPVERREDSESALGVAREADDMAIPVAPADLLASLSYVVVDVETTGGRPWSGDRITEIAAVRVRNGEVADVFETLVNPQRPIPPMITTLTNINWAMVKDAPVFRDVCDRLVSFMQGHVFVAHNAAFDWRFVTAEVNRANGHRLSGRQLCTVRLARKLLPQLRSRSLDHVAHHYGVTIGARHRAGGDAIATAHVLLRLLRDARDRGCESWPALEELVSKRKKRGRRGRPSAMPRSMDRDAGA